MPDESGPHIPITVGPLDSPAEPVIKAEEDCDGSILELAIAGSRLVDEAKKELEKAKALAKEAVEEMEGLRVYFGGNRAVLRDLLI